MPSQDLLDKERRETAPCGLSCGRCVAFHDGAIRRHAAALRELLGSAFGSYAARFADVQPAFGHYEAFAVLLEHLASGACPGCREGSCLFQTCSVPACAREHEVEFCCRCPAYPCGETGFSERLEALWRKNNDLLAQEGVEGFLAQARHRQRYP